MQHKSLLAALMVGVLALASCVKNEESQSVTDMRNARADEIKSQAELNRANAQAAVIYAKAEETIAAAQAQLLKAQADKAAAEAALIQAQADLAQVNVQIQLVKLEEEKVVLQAKKAELEKLIAEYEAAIAQADALKQEAINRLEKAIQQAELDEIKHQKALIDAQADLMKSLSGFADAQRNRVTRLYVAYTKATKQLYSCQTDLLKKQAELAKIQAQIDCGGVDIYNQIVAKKKEISALEGQIAYLEFLSYTSYEEALDKYYEIMPSVVMGMAAVQDAEIALANAQNEWFDTFEDPTSKTYVQPEFTLGWKPTVVGEDITFNKGFQRLAQLFLGDDLVALYDLDDAKVWGYIDDYGNPVPLWKDEVEVEGPGYIYPESEGVAIIQDYIETVDWAPATIYYDNFKAFFDIIEYNYEDDKEEAKREYVESYGGIDDIKSWIEHLEEKNALFAAYIANADEKIAPAKKAMDDAEEAEDAAWKAYLEADNAVDNYSDYAYLSPEYTAYVEASSRYNSARIEDNFVAAQITTAEGEVVGLMNAITTAKEAQLEADEAVVAQQLVVDEKLEAITTEIVTAYTEAKQAVVDQKELIAQKFAAYQEALDDANAKKLVWQADPEDETKEAAYTTAAEAAEQAKEAYNTAVTDLATKNTELETAKDAYDAVNNPYEAAKNLLKNKENVAANKAKLVAQAEKNLADAKKALDALQAQKLLTAEALVLAENNKNEKLAAYQAYATEENPDFKALVDARDAAFEEYQLKEAAYEDAQEEYNFIRGSFNYYWYCEIQLDETDEYHYSNAYLIVRYKEQLAIIEAQYADALAKIEDKYAFFAYVEEELAQLMSVAEPVYIEWLAARKAAADAYVEAYKDYIDVLNEYNEVMVEYRAIESIIVYVGTDEEGYPLQFTRDDFDKLMAGLEKQLADLNYELAELVETLENGTYGEANITKLEGEIAELEAKIEMYEALAESYWAELQYVMSGGIE